MSPSLWVGMDSNCHDPMMGFEHLIRSSLLGEVMEGLLSGAVRPRIYLDWGLSRDHAIENRIIEALVEKRAKELYFFLKNSLSYVETAEAEPISFSQSISELMIHAAENGTHHVDSWAQRVNAPLLWFLTGRNPMVPNF